MNTPRNQGFKIDPAAKDEAREVAQEGGDGGVQRAASDEGQHPDVVDSAGWTGDSDHALPDTPEDANLHPEKKV